MRLIWRSRQRWLRSSGPRASFARAWGQRFTSKLRAGFNRLIGGRHRASLTFGGGVALLSESFNDANLLARGWYDPAAGVTVSTTEQHSGAACLESHFTVGATNTPWRILRHLFTPTPTLYLSVWVKWSANWVGSQTASYHSHNFLIISDLDDDYVAPADNFCQIYIEEFFTGGAGYPEMALQDNRNINTGANVFRTGTGVISGTDQVANTEQRSAGGANGGVESGMTWESFSWPTTTGYYNTKRIRSAGVVFSATPGPSYKNNWHHVEVYLAMNSVIGGIGQHDGVWQYSVDGVVVHNRSDVLFRTGANPTMRFHQLAMTPYIGDTSPVDQTMWVDDMLLLTARPAPLALRGTLRTL